jgi:hypothetical protein
MTMPAHKDFKRLIRGRMRKTGESYTAARAQLLKKRHDLRPVAYAKLAGMSDASLKAKTGCTWERWVRALDGVQAHAWPHRKIVSYVHATYKTPDWWAQMVTVGYERIRGLREIGQQRDGLFRASRSKTFPVPVSRLFRAFSDARTRRHWLPGVELTIRTAIADKSARVTWKDGTSVEAYFAPKGEAKSQLAVQHERLPSKQAAAQMKQYWGERLDALVGVLTGSRESRAGASAR